MMKKMIPLLTALVLLLLPALFSPANAEKNTSLHMFAYQVPRMESAEKGSKVRYGLKDEGGEIVLAPRYDRISELGGGWWAVWKDGRTGLVDPSGKRVRRPDYDAIARCGDGTFITERDGQTGLLSADGREVLSPGAGEFEPVQDGSFRILVNGRCGLLLADGTTFLKPRYDGIELIETGVFRTRIRDRFGLLSAEGRTICAVKYDAVEPWVSEGMYVARIAGKALLFNEKGERCDRAGETVLFGRLDQDEDPGNGAEQVEWIVLKKEGGNLFLVSRLALGCLPFDERFVTGVPCSWQNATLRKCLNGAFLEGAFSVRERERILFADTSGARSFAIEAPDGAKSGGIAQKTEDRVFLLSAYEAEKHFRSEFLRETAPSPAAVSQGAFLSRKLGTTHWWLRSPGQDDSCAAFIDHKGRRDDRFVGYGHVAVRPALWIRID